MMRTQRCVCCAHIYAYYQELHFLEDCPKCGAAGGVADRIVWPNGIGDIWPELAGKVSKK